MGMFRICFGYVCVCFGYVLSIFLIFKAYTAALGPRGRLTKKKREKIQKL